MFDGTRKLFADDVSDIYGVLINDSKNGGDGSNHPRVGIEKIQKALDVLSERVDFAVHNNIPLPVPLSETIRNEVQRSIQFVTNDYDKAVVEKIIMVLVNSENLAKKFGTVVTPEDDDDKDDDHNLQREQVAEEEVLQEQEEEEEEEEVSVLIVYEKIDAGSGRSFRRSPTFVDTHKYFCILSRLLCNLT